MHRREVLAGLGALAASGGSRDAGAATSYWKEGEEGEWVKAR